MAPNVVNSVTTLNEDEEEDEKLEVPQDDPDVSFILFIYRFFLSFYFYLLFFSFFVYFMYRFFYYWFRFCDEKRILTRVVFKVFSHGIFYIRNELKYFSEHCIFSKMKNWVSEIK